MLIDLPKIGRVARKALALQSRPTEESFPELPDVLAWMRAFLGAAFGCFLGLNGTRSGAALVQGVNLVTFVPFAYCRFYLGTSAGQFDAAAVAGGTLPALALMLLVWIYLFTAAFPGDEARLAIALAATTTAPEAGTGTELPGTDGAGDAAFAAAGSDGSEF
jgi:hypothetical protein